LLAAAVTETIGVLAALFPHVWIGIFSSDPNVVAAGSSYLRVVAPFYGFVVSACCSISPDKVRGT
jgi:Na+-driven multidrug efflux pump